MNIKKLAILLLTALWLFLLTSNFITSFRHTSPKADLDRKALLANFFLELQELNQLQTFDKKQTLKGQLLASALDLYSKPNASNSLQLCLIRLAQDKNEEALKILALNKTQKDRKTIQLLDSLINRKHLPYSLEFSDTILKENFSGWFLYKAQTLLYRQTKQTKKSEDLFTDFQNRVTKRFYFLLWTSFWIIAGMVLGIVTLGIYLGFFSRFREIWANPGWDWLNAWGLFIATYLLKDFLYLLIYPRTPIPDISRLFIVYLIANTLFLGLIFYFVLVSNRLSLNDLGFRFGNWKKQILLGLSGYWAAIPTVFCMALLSQWLLKLPSFSSNPVIEMVLKTRNQTDILLLFLMLGIIGPFCEEILFRGFLYPTFRKKLGIGWGIFITALIFSLLHSDPAGIIPILGLGMVLNFLYESTGSILPGFIAHSLWNISVFFFLTRLFG